MLKRLVVLSILLVVIAMTSPAFAQDGTPIKYGDTTSGEITNDTFEVSYLFSGAQGDVIVVEMRRANTDSGLYNAALLLLAPDGSILADSTDYFAYEGADALIAAELPEDGKYTILATRDNGRTGDEEGEYTLKLLQPVELSGTPTQGNVNNDVQDQYYVIRPDGAFNVDYRFLDGNYAPLVDVYLINESGYPESVATLSGVRLDHGTAEVFADEGELFVVAIVVDDLDYMFTDDIEASFEISSSAAS